MTESSSWGALGIGITTVIAMFQKIDGRRGCQIGDGMLQPHFDATSFLNLGILWLRPSYPCDIIIIVLILLVEGVALW